MLLRGPDRVPLSTLTGEDHTDSNPTTVGTEDHLLQPTKVHNLSNSLGVSLVDPVQGNVGVAEVQTLVFPRPSRTNSLNDNYYVGSRTFHVRPVRRDPKCYKTHLLSKQTVKLDVHYPVVLHAPSVLLPGLPQKKGVRPVPYQDKIKHVKGVCCVNPCLFVPSVPSVPSAVSEQNVGGRLQSFWQVWQNMGANPRLVSILKEGYTLPFKQRPLLTRFPLIQCSYSSPTKNMYLKEALISLVQKLVVEKVVVKSSLAFYNCLFLVPKPNRKWRPILDLSRLNLFLSTGTFKMETPETIRLSLKTGECHVARLQRRLFPHPNCTKVKKVSQVLPVQSDLPVHSPTIRTGHSSSGVYQGGQRSKTHGSSEGYQDPLVPIRLVAESPFPGTLPTIYPDPLGPMSAVGLDNKYDQIRVSSQTGLQFRRLPVRADHRSGATHSGPVGNPSRETEVHERPSPVYGSSIHVLDRPPDGHRETGVCGSPSYEAYPVASEEKLACPGSPRKSDSGPSVTPPSFGWWLDEANVLKGQPLHPLQHAVQLFTDASSEGWGAHLGDFTARGVWSPQESLLHINFLELKAVLLAIRQFEHLCKGQIVLVATDNTTVVSYRNKQGGMRSGSLCALLWRLLSWCHPRGIILRARHIPGHLNVIADKLSRHNQVIQTEWSLSQQVFTLLCSRWTQPQVDLFATRFNHKLPRFVSPVPDSTAWGVDALSLQWDQLEAYAFSPPPPCLCFPR